MLNAIFLCQNDSNFRLKINNYLKIISITSCQNCIFGKCTNEEALISDLSRLRLKISFGGPCRIRTYNQGIMSHINQPTIKH